MNTSEQLKRRYYADEEGNRFPPQRFFQPEFMTAKKRKKFDEWWAAENARYEQHPTLHYDIPKNLLEYCQQDVKILRICKKSYQI